MIATIRTAATTATLVGLVLSLVAPRLADVRPREDTASVIQIYVNLSTVSDWDYGAPEIAKVFVANSAIPIPRPIAVSLSWPPLLGAPTVNGCVWHSLSATSGYCDLSEVEAAGSNYTFTATFAMPTKGQQASNFVGRVLARDPALPSGSPSIEPGYLTSDTEAFVLQRLALHVVHDIVHPKGVVEIAEIGLSKGSIVTLTWSRGVSPPQSFSVSATSAITLWWVSIPPRDALGWRDLTMRVKPPPFVNENLDGAPPPTSRIPIVTIPDALLVVPAGTHASQFVDR